MKLYYQCRLQRVDRPTVTQAWIEERGAKVGAKVELKPTGSFWEVLTVGNSMPEDMLRKHQSDHRKSFASIEAMG